MSSRSMVQTRLLDVPIVGLYPIDIGEANQLLVAWDHDLGPVHRPFRQEAYALEIRGAVVAVATSGSIVNGPVGGYERDEVVELTRLARHPQARWSLRVMLRLWREACAPAWPCWPVKAAVSYQLNSKTGDLYRFDGWTKVRDDCGSMGGGTWGRKRKNTDAVYGRKTLWMFPYEQANLL